MLKLLVFQEALISVVKIIIYHHVSEWQPGFVFLWSAKEVGFLRIFRKYFLRAIEVSEVEDVFSRESLRFIHESSTLKNKLISARFHLSNLSKKPNKPFN